MFLFFGVQNILQHRSFLPAKATILDISVDEGVADEPNEYDVLVEYTVDGQRHVVQLNEYNSSMDIGKEVNILYNPDYPSQIIGAGYFGPVISIVFGIVMLAAGVFTSIRVLQGKKWGLG